MKVYILKGYPSDGYYGNILLSFGTDLNIALSTMQGDYSYGLELNIVHEDGKIEVVDLAYDSIIWWTQKPIPTIKYGSTGQEYPTSHFSNHFEKFAQVGDKTFYIAKNPELLSDLALYSDDGFWTNEAKRSKWYVQNTKTKEIVCREE